MKYVILIAISICIFFFTSCRPHVVARPHRAFVIPEYKVKKHWGAPKHFTVNGRYWGRHRYGPRPHRNRGGHHY